jgi:hypothetical protein
VTIEARLARTIDVIGPNQDIVAGRVVGPNAPSWCESRGWSQFLLGLDDDAVSRCEENGAAEVLPTLVDVPGDLADLARAASDASRLEAFAPSEVRAGKGARDPNVRGASPRKREQLDAMLDAMATIAGGAKRIVDFGSGHGQLTSLASEVLGLPSLGLERDPRRVDRAAALGQGREGVSFVAVDAMTSAIDLDERDVALGLHACGALGDRLVVLSAQRGARVALVGCCPQKIPMAERVAISALSKAFSLPKEALGLANLSAGERGVERSLGAMLEARAARYALGLLLSRHEIPTTPGEEMRGLNRRRALRPFDELARAAFALRGRPPPSDAAIAASLSDGRIAFAAMRRLSLPRAALARAIEVFIATDRAAYLVEHGYAACVLELFPREATPRNVAILARPSNHISAVGSAVVSSE